MVGESEFKLAFDESCDKERMRRETVPPNSPRPL